MSKSYNPKGRPIAYDRQPIIAGLLNDDTLKAISLTVGMNHTWLSKIAHNLGFRRMYVTDHERRQILQLRKQNAQ